MEKKSIHKDIEDLIVTFLAGESDLREQEELQQWISASPENKKYFRDRQEIWFASIGNPEQQFDKEKAYKRFLAHVNCKKINPPYNQRNRKHSLQLLLYGAAAVILLLILSYTSYRKGADQVKSRFADIAMEAPLGSKSKIYLPDSTLVWLNAGSKIIYSQGFGVNQRNVRLIGEGYFEVTRNEKLPFQVKTDELQVKVMGTKFNFKNYPDDQEASVCLIEGKVQVRNRGIGKEEVNLIPDQKAFFNKKSGRMRILPVKARYSAEWTNGFLFFDEELLPDIIKKLERSYDVKITLADKALETFRFYGNFIRRENTIENILETLASTGKLKYAIRGKEIKLSLK